MSEFSVYSYQCNPIRCFEDNTDVFPENLKKEDERSIQNMKNHQEIVGEMFSTKVQELFASQKQGDDGKLENCLAFFVGGKRYPFKVLMPRMDEKGDGIIMIRVAKLTKKNREHNFMRGSWIDEPSALVIIDNRHDQQRVLIENTRTWPDTDVLRNIIKSALNEKLKVYRLLMIIEPIWRKTEFWNTVRRYKGHIRSIQFEVGYPNMGRTGDKVLLPLKNSLTNTYASGTITYAFNKNVKSVLNKEIKQRKKNNQPLDGLEATTAMCVDPDAPDPVLDELATHASEYGTNTRLGLDNGSTVHIGKIPNKVRRHMSEEEKKRNPDGEGITYSNVRATLSRDISEFDGQDDLFGKVSTSIIDCLNGLKEINYSTPAK